MGNLSDLLKSEAFLEPYQTFPQEKRQICAKYLSLKMLERTTPF